jgi:hypothetical protein
MIPGKLRIAFSVTFGIAFLLLIGWWAHGYWTQSTPSFGYYQVEQFISDRPGVDTVINNNPELREMLETNFNGGSNGERIYWDSREPYSSRPAEHHPATEEFPATVRVTNIPDISAVDKCFVLVYELHNIQFDKAYIAYTNMAAGKLISRNDYARTCVGIEHSAMVKTRKFFKKHPIVDADPESDPNYVTATENDEDVYDYLKWLDSGRNVEFDILEYYRQAYDHILHPFGLPFQNDPWLWKPNPAREATEPIVNPTGIATERQANE